MESENTLSPMAPPADARPWILPAIGAVVYPGLLMAFAGSVRSFKSSEDVFVQTMFAGFAALSMLLAAAVPITSIPALTRIRNRKDSNTPFIRRILHVVFSVPPLYTLTVVVTSMLGIRYWHAAAWPVALASLGVAFYIYSRKEQQHHGNFKVTNPRMRVVHGGAAALLLVAFLIVHIGNHGFALWSIQLHTQIAELLRLWYQSDWVEPLILALLAVMTLTGVPMVARHTRAGGDVFRVLQTTSGVYLAIFSCSHLTAVLRARYSGVETDWIFATGPNGLLDGTGMLIPYYVLAILTLVMHVAIGLRRVALSHNLNQSVANRMAYALIGIGGFVTLLTTLATLGLHLGA